MQTKTAREANGSVNHHIEKLNPPESNLAAKATHRHITTNHNGMAFTSPMPSQEFLWDVFRR